MPLSGISQPPVLILNRELSLVSYSSVPKEALRWYADADIIYLVDGVHRPYPAEKVREMYDYQSRTGELYIIYYRSQPIGDVCLSREDIAIVIGEKSLWGQGLGTRILRGLIERAHTLGFNALHVADIYRWNRASERCFRSLGFREIAHTEKGASYRLSLTEPWQLRLATAEDYPAVEALMKELHWAHVDTRPDLFQMADPILPPERFALYLEKAVLILAEEAGDIVGLMVLFRKHYSEPVQVERITLLIDDLVVTEAQQGRGIARSLLDEAQFLCRQEKAEAVELCVNVKNTNAMQLYKEYGFTAKALYLELKPGGEADD